MTSPPALLGVIGVGAVGALVLCIAVGVSTSVAAQAASLALTAIVAPAFHRRPGSGPATPIWMPTVITLQAGALAFAIASRSMDRPALEYQAVLAGNPLATVDSDLLHWAALRMIATTSFIVSLVVLYGGARQASRAYRARMDKLTLDKEQALSAVLHSERVRQGQIEAHRMSRKRHELAGRLARQMSSTLKAALSPTRKNVVEQLDEVHSDTEASQSPSSSRLSSPTRHKRKESAADKLPRVTSQFQEPIDE
ncbi:Uncharacterized protein PBTT_09422 [Plasmodiophora brassicae]